MFLDEVDEHIPLTTVIQWTFKQPCHGAVVRWTVHHLDYPLEKIIGTLELIPEESIVLAEFEFFQIHLLHRADPKKI